MTGGSLLMRTLLLGAVAFTGLYIAQQPLNGATVYSCCAQDATCNVVNRNTRCSTDTNCTSLGWNFPVCCGDACGSGG